MNKIFPDFLETYFIFNEFLHRNLPYTILFTTGLILLCAGLQIPVYRGRLAESKEARRKLKSSIFLKWIDFVISLFPLNFAKESLKMYLAFQVPDEAVLKNITNGMVAGLSAVSLVLAASLWTIGRLWYVKVLMVSMSLILPLYVAALAFDLYKYNVGRQIPRMIDEFRSAFIRHRKVRPALKECSVYVDKSLGRIISRIADSAYIEVSLNQLRYKFDNVWFNIFVVLLINYKENGGELIDQLYRLNKTITRDGNIEKKKNKRLIWYELFAVTAAIFSIPSVIWLNGALFGNGSAYYMDAQSNMIISRVIGFSILSLVAIRVLRKL